MKDRDYFQELLEELKICNSCWDARDSPVGQHRCWARIVETISCDCLCLSRHSDLDTIDLDHDLGTRDLTGPFGGEE